MSSIARLLVIASLATTSLVAPTSALAGTPTSGQDASTSRAVCEGGPTFSHVRVRRGRNRMIVLKGGTGDLTGVILRINGVGFIKPPKVSADRHRIKQTGKLQDGSTIAEACPSGCLIAVVTNVGCSIVVAP